MAWQDYQDIRDPWNEPLNPDGSWDGSWYWYDYSADPVPQGCPPPPGGGFGADRRLEYHQAILQGLAKALQVTANHFLPGTTTIRNGKTFLQFRDDLIESVIKALNYMIDYQETVNSGSTRFRGMFIEFKNYKDFHGSYTSPSTSYVSAPHGLSAIIDAYVSLLKLNCLSTTDFDRLNTLVKSVAQHEYGVNSDGGWNLHLWRTEGMIINWSGYLLFKSQINSTGLSPVNMGFEDDLIKWEFWSWDGMGVSLDTLIKRTGLKSVHILDNSANHSKWAEQIVDAQPNQQYKLEGYIRLVSGYQSIYLDFLDANLNIIQSNYILKSANTSFQNVSLTKTSPSNTKYIRIWLYAPWYQTGNGYWDDIKLTKIDLSKDEIENESEFRVNSFTASAFPNPFNNSTNIKYFLPYPSFVKIKIYDLLGREVMNVGEEYKNAGTHNVYLEADKLSSGIYICMINAENLYKYIKIILLK